MIPEGVTPGAVNISALRTHVYVVDVEGGQFWRGAITPDAFDAMLEECATLAFSTETRVLGTILRMRRYAALAEPLNDLTKEIVTLGAWSFAGTKTLEAARKEQGLSGHWIMMYYASKDGSYISNPVHVSIEAGGIQPLQQPTLLALIRKLIEADIADLGQPIAAALHRHGGACIHERFKL